MAWSLDLFANRRTHAKETGECLATIGLTSGRIMNILKLKSAFCVVLTLNSILFEECSTSGQSFMIIRLILGLVLIFVAHVSNERLKISCSNVNIRHFFKLPISWLQFLNAIF